jgi:hypothetical protein
MATKKPNKNIKQFKQALLSNAGFIKESIPAEIPKQEISSVSDEIIDIDVRDKFKILATFEGIDEKVLINKALNHYLKLKGIQLEQAMNKK